MCHKLSSSKSPSIQVLHHQFWVGGWVVLVCADSTDAGGGQNYGKYADTILECCLNNIHIVSDIYLKWFRSLCFSSFTGIRQSLKMHL